MPHGRSIRIYLADGSPSGIRHAEVVNWTGQGIVCPRNRLGELQDWIESMRPGVYLLVGDDPLGSKPLVYVGEAENVLDRLKQHHKDPKKDFWDRVVFFTSKDANLTKSHVKYLESRLVELALVAERAALANGNTPPRPSLPRPDEDAMEEFLGPAKLLMSALGFNFLQPLTRKAGDERSSPPSGPLAEVELYFTNAKHGVDARGRSTDEGFVVLAGSVGLAKVRQSLSKGWRSTRADLIEDGRIEVDGTFIRYTEDVLFSSPSAAAAVTIGGVQNGRDVWRTAAGETLKSLEDGLLQSAESSDD